MNFNKKIGVFWKVQYPQNLQQIIFKNGKSILLKKTSTNFSIINILNYHKKNNPKMQKKERKE